MWKFLLGAVAGIALFGLATQGWIIPPVWDPGHRLYGAASEKGAAAVLDVLARNGFVAKMAFDAGPTHQVVLNDGQRTVIAWFDKEADGLPADAISVWATDPKEKALEAVAVFQRDGFSATLTELPGLNGLSLFLVSSNALKVSGIVFRNHWQFMGRPPERPLPRLN